MILSIRCHEGFWPAARRLGPVTVALLLSFARIRHPVIDLVRNAMQKKRTWRKRRWRKRVWWRKSGRKKKRHRRRKVKKETEEEEYISKVKEQ